MQRTQKPCRLGRLRVTARATAGESAALQQSPADDAAADDSSRAYEPSVPYLAATQRLEELLEQASWCSEEEALRHEVANLIPELKLTLATNVGSLMALTAFVLCWVMGEDPLGGITLQSHSLDAAGLGAAYAAPLLLCSALSRLAPVRAAFPVLADLQDSTARTMRPMMADLDNTQLLLLALVLVPPALLLLLPTVHGCLAVAGAIAAADLTQPLPGLDGGGRQLPAEWLGAQGWLHVPLAVRRGLGALVPALCSAFYAGHVVTRQLDVNVHQAWALREAWAGADRYFLHTAAERVAERPDILLKNKPQSAGSSSRSGSCMASGSGVQGPAATRPVAAAPPAQGGLGGPVTTFASVGTAEPPAWAGAGSAAVDVDKEGATAPPAGALRQLGADMADAFRTVSALWMLSRRRMARLGYVLTCLNISYLYIVWHTAHDLAAPITAGLLLALTELMLIQHYDEGSAAASARRRQAATARQEGGGDRD
ncbi:hypothetical protein HYH02_008827 [Chlamydomonas schloesseri]|uniref:Uncharacterized protein n=1 Tax=Chlamydomonas schloesseri TaxID=2026947 RepID=A0A835WDF1_9CHLO|nr:hypothetical protein HYH02_008827 [Chlamydomonas schloesseri]|eukprot:KAG2445362.1 hypothetical protein HYH02_008827 [Chlamydomonas schloesseri]